LERTHSAEDVPAAELVADPGAETEAPAGESAPTRIGSSVVRIGFWICGAALLVTLAGSVVLGQGATPLEPIGEVVHRSGMLLLLAGFLVVLIGYRVPQLQRLHQVVTNSGAQAVGERSRGSIGVGGAANYSWQIGLQALFILTTVTVVMLVALIAVPAPWFSPALAYLQILIAASMIVVIVYDRGLLQAFCIAALLPALLAVLVTSGFALTGARFSAPSPDLTIAKVAVAVHWGITLAIGTFGIAVRAWLAMQNRD